MFRTTVFAALVGAAFASAQHAVAADSYKLTYATYLSGEFSPVKLDNWFMEEVTKRTNGRVTFEPYYSGSLLKAADLMPGLGAGAVDIANSVPSAYNRQEYVLSNITLPFISDDVEAVTRAFKELYETDPAFRNEYESKGIKMLYAPAAAENTIWSNKPIRSAADIPGIKVRAVLGVGDALNMLGAAVLAMPFPDAVEGLQRGTVDAISTAPFDTAVAGGLPEIVPYGSDMGAMGIYATHVTAISLSAWNRLDAEAQQVIEEVTAETADRYRDLINEVIQAGAEKLAARAKEGKVEITIFDDAASADIRERVAPQIEQAWIDAANATGIDGRAVMERFKALIAKYEAESTYETGFARVRQIIGQ